MTSASQLGRRRSSCAAGILLLRPGVLWVPVITGCSPPPGLRPPGGNGLSVLPVRNRVSGVLPLPVPTHHPLPLALRPRESDLRGLNPWSPSALWFLLGLAPCGTWQETGRTGEGCWGVCSPAFPSLGHCRLAESVSNRYSVAVSRSSVHWSRLPSGASTQLFRPRELSSALGPPTSVTGPSAEPPAAPSLARAACLPPALSGTSGSQAGHCSAPCARFSGPVGIRLEICPHEAVLPKLCTWCLPSGPGQPRVPLPPTSKEKWCPGLI